MYHLSTMKAIYHYPLFFIALSLFLGILSNTWDTHIDIGFCIISLFVMAGLLLVDTFITDLYYEWIFTICVATTFFSIGILLMDQHRQLHPNEIEHINCRKVSLGGVVSSHVKKQEKGQSFIIDASAYQSEMDQKNIQGKLKVYLDKEIDIKISRFDTVYLQGNITTLQSYYRDYLAYMNNRGIWHVMYVKEAEKGRRKISFRSTASRMQEIFIARFNQMLYNPEIRALALAMFLGDKSTLSPDIREQFAIAGASHILAISGMHIGIIYMILQLILSFFHLILHGKKIKYGIILLILIIYMGITGASPAVVRATCMFGIMIVMKLLSWRYHILNIIGISGIIQMIVEPAIVFSISFQLSYTAVWGIIILYRQWEKLIQTPWKVLNYFYSWIGITLCATVSTAPLVWVNFGAFPVYFLLTNVLISLLSIVIVWIGFLFVLLMYVPYVSHVLAWLAELLLSILADIIYWISTLPHAQLTYMSIFEPGIRILFIELIITFLLLLPGLFYTRTTSTRNTIWT